MKFLRSLFSGKPRPEGIAPLPGTTRSPEPVDTLDRVRRGPSPDMGVSPKPSLPGDRKDTLDKRTSDILRAVAEKAKEPDKAAGPGIWDMDDSVPSAEQLLARASQAPAKGRGRRVKTRLVGFDTSEGAVVDLFKEGDAKPEAEVADTGAKAGANAGASSVPMFPVGWLLVVEGPGRGASYALLSGMSQIGRGADQAVRLDHGDNAISRSGHAAVVFDPEAKTFLLGQGGKSNIVRLNGTPVISNEAIKDGDKIKVGETVLQLKTLCGPDFDWNTEEPEEDDDDVAIA